VLQLPVNCPEGTEHTQDTENFEESDAGAAEDGDQRHGDHHNVQAVERGPTEGSGMEQKPLQTQIVTRNTNNLLEL
jgi:hypothetical protein